MIDFWTYLHLYFTPPAWKKELATQYWESIYHLNYLQLKQKGINTLIFDVDDTLRGHLDQLPPQSIKLIRNLHRQKFKIVFFSNMKQHGREEVKKLVKSVPIIFSTFNNKPNPEGFHRLFHDFRLKARETAMIGDRIGIDLFGAYLAGIPERILVEPYSSVYEARKAPLYTSILRSLEKFFFAKKRQKI